MFRWFLRACCCRFIRFSFSRPHASSTSNRVGVGVSFDVCFLFIVSCFYCLFCVFFALRLSILMRGLNCLPSKPIIFFHLGLYGLFSSISSIVRWVSCSAWWLRSRSISSSMSTSLYMKTALSILLLVAVLIILCRCRSWC